jgi:predicted  nucleic acid-binding Zn-ribbon protein
MEDLKKDVRAVKTELDAELKKIDDVNSKLESIRDEQKHVSLVHKEELSTMEDCVKQCQISIGQHNERLRAYEANSIRQNGILNKLDEKIDDLGTDIHGIVTKVDAMDLNIANRMNSIERNGIKRESAAEKARLASDAATRIATIEDIGELRAEFIKQNATDSSTFHWKIIGALSSLAFLFILVFISYSFHVFGGLP